MNREGRSKLAVLLAVLAVSGLAFRNEIASAASSRMDRTGRMESMAAVDPAADGTAIYSGKCALCHGKDGAGLPHWRSKGQPDFTKPEWQESHSDQEISEDIKNGKGKYMPAFKNRLSEEEIGALVQRLRAFGRKK